MSCPSWVFFPPDQIASVLLATSDMACFQTQRNLPSSWLLFHQFPPLRSWCLIFRLTTQLGSGPKQDHHSLFLHTIILLPFPKIVLLNCWTTIYLRKKVSMMKISWESTSYSIPLLEIHRAFSTLKPPKSWITLIHLSILTCMRPSNLFHSWNLLIICRTNIPQNMPWKALIHERSLRSCYTSLCHSYPTANTEHSGSWPKLPSFHSNHLSSLELRNNQNLYWNVPCFPARLVGSSTVFCPDTNLGLPLKILRVHPNLHGSLLDLGQHF